MPIQLTQPKLAKRQHHAPSTTDHALEPPSGGSDTEEEAFGVGAFSRSRTGKASRDKVLAGDAINVDLQTCGCNSSACLEPQLRRNRRHCFAR